MRLNGRPSVQPTPVQVPVIEIGGVNLSVGAYPKDPTMKAILIGPVVLALPLSDDAAKVVVRGLTGIEIVRPGTPIDPPA